MATEPFSSNADTSGTGGVGGYAASTGPATSSKGAMNPAFGRSSRDLASDSGPAAAPQGLWSTPDTATETTAGTGQTADPDVAPDRRPGPSAATKTNPDVDPDTRLGLRPATRGMVAPRLPTYPVSDPGTRVATGALAGLIGAAAVVVVAYGLHAAGLVGAPPSLAAATKLVDRPEGGGALGYVAGMFGALMAGAIWGLLFGLVVRRPTILKGMVFGVLPALFQWLVLSPLLGQGLFFSRSGLGTGIGLPLLFNVLIFGSVIGYYGGRWLRPPYTGAVDPDVTSAVPNP